jgi:hypothetical protein
MIHWVETTTMGGPERWMSHVQEWRLEVVEIRPDGPARSHPYRWNVKGPGVDKNGAEPSAGAAQRMAEAQLPEAVRDRVW